MFRFSSKFIESSLLSEFQTILQILNLWVGTLVFNRREAGQSIVRQHVLCVHHACQLQSQKGPNYRPILCHLMRTNTSLANFWLYTYPKPNQTYPHSEAISHIKHPHPKPKTYPHSTLLKQRWVEPTILSPTVHQKGNWCAGKDKLVGSAHLCFYSEKLILMYMMM